MDQQELREFENRCLQEQPAFCVAACPLHVDVRTFLVPTLVPGVNVHNIGAILEFAKEMAPAVRGVHFQPVSYEQLISFTTACPPL